MHAILLLALFTALTFASPAQAAERPPTMKYDPYTKTLSIVGSFHLHNALLDLNKPTYWLQASIVAGSAGPPLLFYDLDTPDWRFLDSAADIDGNALPVIQVSRDLSYGGGVHELVAVQLTPEYITLHRTIGMNIKLIGSRGERVVQIASAEVVAFADVYDREVAKVAVPRAVSESQNLLSSQAVFGTSFVPNPLGALIISIVPRSRAALSGLQPGSIVTAVGGKSIAGLSAPEVTTLLRSLPSRGVLTLYNGTHLSVP